MILYMIFFMIDGKDFIMYARDDDDASVVTPSLRLFSCYRAAIIIILSCLLYTSHCVQNIIGNS